MSKVDRALILQVHSAATVLSASPVKDVKLTLTNASRRLVLMTPPASTTSGNSAAPASTVSHFQFRLATSDVSRSLRLYAVQASLKSYEQI